MLFVFFGTFDHSFKKTKREISFEFFRGLKFFDRNLLQSEVLVQQLNFLIVLKVLDFMKVILKEEFLFKVFIFVNLDKNCVQWDQKDLTLNLSSSSCVHSLILADNTIDSQYITLKPLNFLTFDFFTQKTFQNDINSFSLFLLSKQSLILLQIKNAILN